MREIVIDKRHQGPFGSVNGGYLAGVLGDVLNGEPTTVRIHRPVPVNTEIWLSREDDTAMMRLGDQTLVSARVVPDEIPQTRFVSIDEALAAEAAEIDMAIFAECFVCGQETPRGLGVRPKQLPDGRFVSIWRPAESRHVQDALVEARHLRSALDCPGGFAALVANQTLAVTGTLTSRVNFLPDADETLIVVGEATFAEGRKLGAVSTIFNESDEVVATATAVWVVLDPAALAVA